VVLLEEEKAAWTGPHLHDARRVEQRLRLRLRDAPRDGHAAPERGRAALRALRQHGGRGRPAAHGLQRRRLLARMGPLLHRLESAAGLSYQDALAGRSGWL
jgi:hypothetical protein